MAAFLVSLVSYLALLKLPQWTTAKHAVLTALVSAFVLFVLYLVARVRDEERWRKSQEALEGRCRADNDPFIVPLELRGTSEYDRNNFLHDCHRKPAEAKNILLVVRETGKQWWDRVHPYSMGSISRQIEELEKHANDKFGKIKWVAFVTHGGTFVAFQSMKKFSADLKRGHVRLAQILNEHNPQKFREMIADDITEENKQKDGEPARDNIVQGLQQAILFNLPLTTKEAIALMHAKGWSEAMLVSSADRKPIGMVTLKMLLQESALKDLLNDSDLKALEDRFAAQEAIAKQAFEAVEGWICPKPAGNHGDDSPEREP